jgi:Uma2 family endonuclease
MIVPLRFREIRLPDSDDQPMADNTLQFEWISTLKWGLDDLFVDRPDVFVAGDHLIYPVAPEEKDEENAIRIAPDVYVVFGRPKGHRGSYKLWEEEGIFPQVVFEVWSPSNRLQQMEDKRATYEQYGAEEYYIVYPEFPANVDGWNKEDGKFVVIRDITKWVSPRLGIRFEIRKGHLNVIRPDGTKFLTVLETNERLRTESHRAGQEAKRAEQEAMRAEQEAKRAESAEQRAEQERERAERLAAKLRELGLDPDAK